MQTDKKWKDNAGHREENLRNQHGNLFFQASYFFFSFWNNIRNCHHMQIHLFGTNWLVSTCFRKNGRKADDNHHREPLNSEVIWLGWVSSYTYCQSKTSCRAEITVYTELFWPALSYRFHIIQQFYKCNFNIIYKTPSYGYTKIKIRFLKK